MERSRSERHTTYATMFALFAFASGCGAAGDACEVDENCLSGMICASGTCRASTRDSGTRLGDVGPMVLRDAGPGVPSTSDGGAIDVGEGDGDPCGDGLDGDLDGRVDEGCSCEAGATQPCFLGAASLAGVGSCSRGTQSCVASGEFGAWGTCTGSGAPSIEVCEASGRGNGLDEDCDGERDETCGECVPGATAECFEDGSGTPLSGTAGVGRCVSGQKTCGGPPGAYGVCVGAVGAETETCGNGIDDDCDGAIDDGCTPPCDPQFLSFEIPASQFAGAHATGGPGHCEGMVYDLGDPSGPGPYFSDGRSRGMCDGSVAHCGGTLIYPDGTRREDYCTVLALCRPDGGWTVQYWTW